MVFKWTLYQGGSKNPKKRSERAVAFFALNEFPLGIIFERERHIIAQGTGPHRKFPVLELDQLVFERCFRERGDRDGVGRTEFLENIEMVVSAGDQQGMEFPDDLIADFIEAVGRKVDVVRFPGLPGIGGTDLGMEDDDPRQILSAGAETLELRGFQPGVEAFGRDPGRRRF